MTSLKVLSEFKIASQPGNERKAVKQVAGGVAHLNLPVDTIERLKTAVAEAVMNAMEHGNHYEAHLPVEVEVVLDETAPEVRNLVLCIRDLGGSQEIPASEPPDLEAKLAGRQSPRGWGLFLIKNMVDEMRVTSDGLYHTVELVFHLEGAA
jgi:anti-sigma regulatory factor (Ser/Thr protein kinase)